MNKFIPCQKGAMYAIPYSCGGLYTMAKLDDHASDAGYEIIARHKKLSRWGIWHFTCMVADVPRNWAGQEYHVGVWIALEVTLGEVRKAWQNEKARD